NLPITAGRREPHALALAPTLHAHPRRTPFTVMPLSTTDAHRIAPLARIEIDAAQAEEVRVKLDAIFAMFNELQAIDTTGVVPMAHAEDVLLPMAEDKV